MTTQHDITIQTADILVVDDTIESLKLLSDILSNAGYWVRPANGPQSALESAWAQPPSLILLDVRMPEMSGFEVCRRLKQDERTHEIPIIFVSALQDMQDRVQGFEAGGVDFISKPFQEAEVLARVNTHLQLRRMQLHLEGLVAERTAELKEANEALRKEIAERKAAQETLRQSEAQYRWLTESTEDIVSLYDANMAPIYMSPACERVLGYRPEELKSMSIADLLHPEDLTSFLEKVARDNAARQEIARYEGRIRHKEGHYIWVESITKREYDQDGNLVRFLDTTRSINERKQAEVALHEARLFTDNLIDTANVMIIGLDVKGAIHTFNPAAERLTGYTQQELDGKNWFEVLVPKEQYLEVWQEFERLLGEGLPKYFENPILTKDGEERIITWSNNEIKAGGNIAGTLSFGIDITQRIKAEEALKASEEEFRNLMEQSPISIQLMTPDGWITKVNRAFMALWGIPEDSLPEVLTKYNMLEDEEARRHGVMPLIEKAFKGEAVVLPVIGYETVNTMDTIGVNLKADKRWIQARLYPVKNKKGEVVSVVAMEEDITEQRQAEERVQQYQQRLKALASQLTIAEEQERRRIAADLHDHVGHALALARMQVHAVHEATTQIQTTALLNDLSNLLLKAIQETKTLIFELSAPTMNEIGLAAAIAEWLEEYFERRYGLETELIDTSSNRVLDLNVRAILFRNVRELLTNVVKHAHAKHVTVALEDADECLRIRVKDDGVGVDPDAVARHVKPGGGFGLFSIQERLADLGGSLEILSEPGQGCEVIMIAPFERSTNEGV